MAGGFCVFKTGIPGGPAVALLDQKLYTMAKYRIPIPISRYFKIPIPNTEPTKKIPTKIPNTDTDLKYRHRHTTSLQTSSGSVLQGTVPVARQWPPFRRENSADIELGIVGKRVNAHIIFLDNFGYRSTLYKMNRRRPPILVEQTRQREPWPT